LDEGDFFDEGDDAEGDEGPDFDEDLIEPPDPFFLP
jgi:hypothetical protein